MSKRGWPHVDDPVAVGQAPEGGAARRRPEPARAFVPRLHGRLHLPDRARRPRPSLQVLRELARRVGVEEDYLATGSSTVDRVRPAARGRRRAPARPARARRAPVHAGARRATDARSSGRARSAGSARSTCTRAASTMRSSVSRRRASCSATRIAEQPGARRRPRAGVRGAASTSRRSACSSTRSELVRGREDEQAETRFTVLLANVLIDSGSLPRARELLGYLDREGRGRGRPDPAGPPLLVAVAAALGRGEHRGGRPVRTDGAGVDRADRERRVRGDGPSAPRAHRARAREPAEALDLLERGHELARADRRRLPSTIASGSTRRARLRRSAGTTRRSRSRLEHRRQPDRGTARSRPAARTRSPPTCSRGTATRRRRSSCTSAPPSSPISTPSSCATLYAKMAELLEQEGRTDEALELLKRAVATQAEARDRA